MYENLGVSATIYLLLMGLKHTATVVLSYGPSLPCLGTNTNTWETSGLTGLHRSIPSSRTVSLLFWRSTPYTTITVKALIDYQFIIQLINSSDPQLLLLSQRALLTASVPAAVSRSRPTQSHARGDLFLRTTFFTLDVPKYNGPNHRQDSGASWCIGEPC